MKALRIVEAGRTDIVDVADPGPGPGEVKIRVARVGLCGTDLNTFRGQNPLVSYPRIPGHEISGVVLELGGGVSGPAPGTPVFVVPYQACGSCPSCRRRRGNACRANQTLGVHKDGAATERLVVPADRLLTHARLSLPDMALVEPITIGAHSVDRGRVLASDTVVVFGAGTVGLGAIAVAARRGARVIVVDVDERKLALARQAGARDTLNSRTNDPRQALAAMTNGDGPDVVIEAVGLPETYRLAVDVVAYTGRVVCVGYSGTEVAFATKLFILKELDILGSRNATPPDLQAVADLMAQDVFPREISHVVALERAGGALADWSADPSRVTKIQIDPSLAG